MGEVWPAGDKNLTVFRLASTASTGRITTSAGTIRGIAWARTGTLRRVRCGSNSRLREAGMVNGTPQKLIAQGTDWRYLNELKRELKA